MSSSALPERRGRWDIRDEHIEPVMRAKSVKHAEYEIFKVLLYDGWRPVDTIHLTRLHGRMVPKGDEVANKRWLAACQNIGVIMRNLMKTRVKHLPKEHVDYEGDTQ